MGRRTGRAPLELNAEQRSMLRELAGSRTGAQREVERAKVLLAYAEGKSPTEIERMVGVSRPTIYKCIDKALAAGVAMGLKDRFHRPHAPQISEAAKAFVIDLAGWTSTFPARRSFELCWTITARTSPRKRWPIWPVALADSSTSTHPSMVRG